MTPRRLELAILCSRNGTPLDEFAHELLAEVKRLHALCAIAEVQADPEAIRIAVEQEREACLAIADRAKEDCDSAGSVAEAIRARGK